MRNPLFPNVNPADIPVPTPTVSSNPAVTRQSDDNVETTHQRPPIPSSGNARHDYTIYPYGSQVTAQIAGKPVDCWIQRCIQKGLEYEASMSGGETVRFRNNDVIMQDLTSTPTKVPDNYVVNMLGGHGKDPNPLEMSQYRHPYESYQQCTVTLKANIVIIVIRMTMTTDVDTHHEGVNMCCNMLIMPLYILTTESHNIFGKTRPVQ